MTFEQHQKGLELVNEMKNIDDYINSPLPIEVRFNGSSYYYRIDNDIQIKALLLEAKQYLEEAIKMYLQSKYDALNKELENI